MEIKSVVRKYYQTSFLSTLSDNDDNDDLLVKEKIQLYYKDDNNVPEVKEKMPHLIGVQMTLDDTLPTWIRNHIRLIQTQLYKSGSNMDSR